MACLAMGALAGCEASVSPSSSSQSSGSTSVSVAQPGELTEEHKLLYTQYLTPLMEDGSLMSSWSDQPSADEENYGLIQDLEVVASSKEGNVLSVTARLYGTLLLDPHTMEESMTGDGIIIAAEPDSPHGPYLAFGEATVEMREVEGGPLYLSCTYEPYDAPGVTLLRERTKELEPQLSASQKPDLSQYEPRMVEYIRQVILSQRYIESADEITLWDLENLCTDLIFNYSTLGDENRDLPRGYVADSQILRLMPNLEFFVSYVPLTDYSVFEEMHQLKSLCFYLSAGDSETPAPDFSTLRIGHTKDLTINEFQHDIVIDLSHSEVESLTLSSWMAAVTEFRGCEDLQTLNFNHTRSDTRIINAQTFPSLQFLNLDFFSDTPRFRDLSQLATFGEDVNISVTLSYQAANNKTVETLAGVRLNSLYLDPDNGPYPLGEPDPALVEKINAEQVNWATTPGDF